MASRGGWSGDSLKRDVEQALGTGVEPKRWRELREDGTLDLVRQGELSLADLAGRLRGRRARDKRSADTGDTPTPAPPVERDGSAAPAFIEPAATLPDNPTGARRYALSRVLAADAGHRREVEDFRRDYLGGQLLSWDEVDRWVDTHAGPRPEGDGPPSVWLSDVAISQDQVTKGTERAQEGYTALGPFTVPLPWRSVDEPDIGRLEKRFLYYLLPGQTNARLKPVAAGGTLDHLRRVSEYLAADFPWTPEQASVFALTGLIPYVEAYGKITLTLDPTTPLQEVTARFVAERRRLIGERQREMSLKHLQLAVFTAERPPELWRKRLEAWNQAFPQWAYEPHRLANFTRDSQQATRRLLLEERA
ncbi:MAG TPA: hypothetical protein VF120_01725 [Ktedonobacterales bacterium]